MSSAAIKRVPRHVVVGPRGLPAIERGYTEIGGVRFYESMIVVGDRGEPTVSPGWMEIGPDTANS